MAKTIVGTFETMDDAQRVGVALEQGGVDRRQIEIIDSASAGEYEGRWSREHRGSSGGFWSWLFGGDDIEAERGRGFPEDDARSYTEGLTRGDVLIVVTTSDDRADRVRQLMEQHGAQDVESDVAEEPSVDASHTGVRSMGASETGPMGAASGTGTRSRGAGEDEQVIPVVEEQLKVGKRSVSRGGVRVYSHVSERPVEAHIRLREERIRIERRPVDRPLTGTPTGAFKEQTIDLTESVEEPVVQKQAQVVEEVSVSKDVHERDETVRDKARRTDVEVQRTGGTQGGFAAMESDFRQHCTRTLGGKNVTYEQCSPAYEYGYKLGGDSRYGGDWTAVEADARREWERQHPGTWERFKDAVRYAWDRTRGEARAA
jgi:uncharacterized protein (TIGR02271 family)